MPRKAFGENHLATTEISGAAIDEIIERTVNERIGDVTMIAEGNRSMIGTAGGVRNAAEFLVSRLVTDAVFSADIRAIQLIINRIDGGLPKDTDIAHYRTDFGDCLNKVMAMPRIEQLMVVPEDTVMMALCKSLVDIATQDIYWDPEKLRKRRPSDSVKKERDAALRIILERTGGRKTLVEVAPDTEDVEIAPWIARLEGNVS